MFLDRDPYSQSYLVSEKVGLSYANMRSLFVTLNKVGAPDFASDIRQDYLLCLSPKCFAKQVVYSGEREGEMLEFVV